jgi:Ulp1 family protease
MDQILTYEVCQVPHQQNTHDCGCFTIYFARRFFQDPISTLEIIKVVCLFITLITSIDFPYPDSISVCSRWTAGMGFEEFRLNVCQA